MAEHFLDSSAIYAFTDKNDASGIKVASYLKEQLPSLVTTNFILAEAVSLITKRLGKSVGIKTGEILQNSNFVRLVYLGESFQREAWDLYKKYKDKDFDLIDATSFVFCRQQKIQEIVTLDRHFSQMGFKVFPE